MKIKGELKLTTEPTTLSFYDGGRELFRITGDREVVVKTDIYEAAKDFWDMVFRITPEDWIARHETYCRD